MLKEFKNDIYPCRLWVATSWKDVKDKFSTYGDYDFRESEQASATTYPKMVRKSSGKCGVLIVFNDSDKVGGSEIVANISHESLHAANCIFRDIGMEYSLDNDEHAAYMVGWIARCCWKVLQKEIYKDNK